MDYAIANEMKDAGFTQKGGGETHYYNGDKRVRNEHALEYPSVYIPTLSELIEACGEEFHLLGRISSTWHANPGMGNSHQTGSTPEEAVARLWLALQK